MIKTAIPIAVALAIADVSPARVIAAEAQTEEVQNVASRAVERLLVGEWRGPPCGGTYVFKEDGTFTLDHFTPGNNSLAGTWEVRWDALPPKLVLTCKTTDDEQRLPAGKVWQHKLLQLNKESMAFEYADYPGPVKFKRVEK